MSATGIGGYQSGDASLVSQPDLKGKKETQRKVFFEAREKTRRLGTACCFLTLTTLAAVCVYIARPRKETLGVLIGLVSLTVFTCIWRCRKGLTAAEERERLLNNSA